MHKVKGVGSLSFVETRYTETKPGCILGEKTGKRLHPLAFFSLFSLSVFGGEKQVNPSIT